MTLRQEKTKERHSNRGTEDRMTKKTEKQMT